MTAGMKSLIALSFLGGLALWLCPEGSVKRVMQGLVAALLVSAAVNPLCGLDFDALSLNEARINSAQAEIINSGRQHEDLLKKLLMKQNCENYIAAKGASLGLRILHVSVELETDGGTLTPSAAGIRAAGSGEAVRQLQRLICDDLGIPTERQAWTINE